MPTSIPLRNEKARDDSSRAPQDDLRSDPYVRGKRNDRERDACRRCRCNDDVDDDIDDDEASEEEDDCVFNDCGLEHRTPGRCPATGKRCLECNKKGQFAIMCPSKRRGRKQAKETNEVHQNFDSLEIDEPCFYLG